jgi:type VI secretion system protein ImpE
VRSEGLEAATATPGTINGTAFEWIADADSRLGPILEVLLNGAYYWVPFERIQRVVVEPPSDARDLVWVPAQFMWSNGGEAMGLLPVRYPGSELSTDAAIRLSRKTEWRELGGEINTNPNNNNLWAGLGQRVLTSDAEEFGLLQVRAIELNGVPGGG